jgi:serine/threonine protein kinase
MKWGDFGLSKQVNERGTYTMSEVKGTYNYYAPEILKLIDEESSNKYYEKKRGTVKSDVFAEGLVFGYFVMDGLHPFGASNYQISVNVRTKRTINLPSKLILEFSNNTWTIRAFSVTSFPFQRKERNSEFNRKNVRERTRESNFIG